jgi:hypothetical protein
MLPIPSNTRTYLARASVIGAATPLCGVASMLFSLATLHASLPEGDTAKDQPLIEILSDPLLMPVALTVAFGMSAIAYPFAFFLLVHTRLRLSIPCVLVATLLGTALGALSHLKLCFFLGGPVAGLAAMVLCNRRFRDVVRPGL